MNVNDYLGKMQKIQRILFEYLDKEDTSEEEDQQVKFIFFDDISIDEKPAIMKETFLMISHIFDFHNRSSNLKEKIEHIILFYKDQIKQTFSNKSIFNIFKNNKLLLIFLFKEKIIDIDSSIANSLKKFLNNEFFSKEINSFYSKEINNDEAFEKKRQIGENDSRLCELIRNDSIDEFIEYINKNCINLTSTILPSIFETHPDLISKNVSLIDYSAFFGSIRIFLYLQANNVRPENTTWILSIHSKNAEIISKIEENEPYHENKALYYDCFIESIKCHHNEISKYFVENFIQKENNINLLKDIIPFYNFFYFNEEDNFQKYLPNLIQFNYVTIVKLILNNVDIFHKLFTCYKYIYDDIEEELEQQTLFSISIIYENIEIFKHLLTFSQGIAGGKIEITNKIELNFYSRINMIYYAVETDNNEIVDIMLKSKCFAEYNDLHDYFCEDIIYDQDADGDDEVIFTEVAKTVLTTAVENNNKVIVELLLNTGKVDINLPYIFSKHLGMGECEPLDFYEIRKTPLCIAVESGNKEIVELLLDRNKIKLDGCYMLKSIDVMKLKVRDAFHFYYSFPPPPDSEITENLSALDIAKRNGYDDIYTLLLNKKQY